MAKEEIEPAGNQTDYAKQQKHVKHEARIEQIRKADAGPSISEQLRGPKDKGK